MDNPARILIIDDDRLMREILSRTLRKQGYSVVTTTSGDEGLASLEKDPYDLVLCDVIMPGMDGIEVCRRLRARAAFRSLPIILLTALSKVEDVVRGLEAGANDYLGKPFHEAELLARIVAHLIHRRVREETVSLEKHLSLGRLTGGLCHEINNPLTVVLGHIEMLLMDETHPRKRRLMTLASENAKRIQRLVQLMRQYAEPVVHERVPCDLNRVIQNALSIASLGWSSSKVRLQCQFTTPLPSVLADEERLQQVFLNLLVNAHQFSPPDGEVLLSTAVANLTGEWVWGEVSDRGKGIPRENIGRIFDPFWTTKDNWQSPGLGLAVARRIVEEHQGRIEVESAPGQGARFRVLLPVHGPPLAGSSRDAPSSSAP